MSGCCSLEQLHQCPFVINKPKEDTKILADAADRLLRATKAKMLREKGRIDYAELARDGFRPAMIERLKAL
jgi:hypothetical protein